MKANYYIKQYCSIESGLMRLNGNVIFESDETAFSDFAKQAYHALDLAYPKFFKMDKLSKLAFLGASQILKEYTAEENNVALVFANKSASLDTDLHYQKSIANVEDYFPSPSVFVYTLPNICLGEISIKYKLYSENSFFVSESFDVTLFKDYSEILLDTEKATEVLCGWVELLENAYKAVFYLVSKNGNIEHLPENINTIFDNGRINKGS